MAGVQATITIDGKVNGKLFSESKIEELGKWVSSEHYIAAQAVLGQEQKDGFDKNPRVRTDNKWEKPARNVIPFGKIEYYARVDISEAILYSYKMVEQRSPRGKTGRYESSNAVYYKSKLVAESYTQLASWLKNTELTDGSVVRFVNLMPYASRLELSGIKKGTSGATKGLNTKNLKTKTREKGSRIWAARQPNGTYFTAVKAIRRKYKGAGELIKFAWAGQTSGIKVPSRYGYRTTYHPSNKRRNGSAYVYPSIMFVISGEGIL